MTKEDLIPRLVRVFQLMVKQLNGLTQKELMILLKDQVLTDFFKNLTLLEEKYELDEKFFTEHLEKIIEWQRELPGGIINVKKDFIKYYTKVDKYEKAHIKEKILLHQPNRMKESLIEFFRLLDTAVSSKKSLPIQAYAQHLGLTLDELAEQLDRINWEDKDVKIEEEEVKEGFTLPIHIEKDFFAYYHSVDKLTKKHIQDRTTQGIGSAKQKMQAFFSWLDLETKAEDLIGFDELVNQADMPTQELIRYLDRINWQ